jgi:tetratricopeptide (TPR) repeat protein
VSDPGLKSESGPKSKGGSSPQNAASRTGRPSPGAGPGGPRRPRRRVNTTAALALGLFVLVAVPGFVFIRSYQNQHKRSALLAEAKQLLDNKKPNDALLYLNRYLELNPNDPEALTIKSKLLFDTYQLHGPDYAATAIPVHEQLTRVDPKDKEAKRRLLRLNAGAGRIQTAYNLARELTANSPTGEDYRLLGSTLKALAEHGTPTLPEPDGNGEFDTWQEAIESFEKARQLDPGNVPGAYELARLYQTQAHDPKQAVQVLDQLLEQAKTPTEQAAVHLARFQFFSQFGSSAEQAQKARAELEEALRLQPDNPQTRLVAAMEALGRGDTEMARRHIDAVAAKISPEILAMIAADIDRREQKYDDAIKKWRAGLKATGGTSERITWQLTFVLLQLGRVDEAKPLLGQFHRLIGGGSSRPEAVYLDALLALKEGKPAEAIPKLESIRLKAESEDQKDKPSSTGKTDNEWLAVQIDLALGQGYEAADQDQQALEAYRQAAKLVRGSSNLRAPEPWVAAANVLTRANRLDEARAELQDGLASLPDDATLLYNLSKVQLIQQARLPKDRRNLNNVEQLLNAARQVAPNSVDLIKLQVAELATAGRLKDAATLLANATDPKHHLKDPYVWALQAEILRQLGQHDQALDAIDRGTALFGDQAVLRIARSHVLNSQGRERDAYDTLKEGLTRVPTNQRPLLWRELGVLYQRRNNVSGIREVYKEWAKAEPSNPQPQLLLLEMALAARDEEAIASAQAAAARTGKLTAQLAEALVLLKKPMPQDEKAREARLAEASNAIEGIIAKYPARPVGYLLRGQLYEMQGHIDDAIHAYHEARDHSGGYEALRSLYLILATHGRYDDLKRLQGELSPDERNPELEKIAAQAALISGDKTTAEMLTRDIVRGDSSLATQLWYAQFENSLGDSKKAEEILREQIRQRPDELSPRIALLVFQLSQRQFDKARETVDQIRENVKDDRPEFIWASCYRTINDVASARQYYKIALEKWPDDPEVRQTAIAFFRTTEHSEDAEAALREILKREPKHAWATRELAQLLSARKGDQAAWSEALKIIGEGPREGDTDEDRLVRATVLARSGDSARQKQAIEMLNDLVANSNPGPVNTMAHELLARMYFDASQSSENTSQAEKTKDLNRAKEHAEAAAARGNDPNTLIFYTELLMGMKQYDEALKQVDRLAQLEPDTLRTLMLRVKVLAAQDKVAEATNLLERSFSEMERSSGGELIGRQILAMLVELKQFDAAERVGTRLAVLWPRSAWALADVLGSRNKIEEALKQCKVAVDAGEPVKGAEVASLLVTARPLGNDAEVRLKQADEVLMAALKQKPDNFGILFARASVQRLLSHFDDAMKIYRDLLAKSPESPLVLNNMAWTLSEDLKQPKEALERINTAIKKMGTNPSLLDTRGVILTRLGKSDEAIADLEAAAAAAPSPTVYYHLARAYHQAGRNADFQKYRSRAKEAGLDARLLQPGERAEMNQIMSQ